jgi:hypothetical protein
MGPARQPLLPSDSEGRFNRSSRLVLAFALVLIGLSTAELGYRLSLPTDGWIIGLPAMNVMMVVCWVSLATVGDVIRR